MNQRLVVDLAAGAVPRCTISLTGNLMGDWLRDALDPRLRHVR